MKTEEAIRTLFKDRDGDPYIATPGQVEIFKSIVDDSVKRVVVKAMTQYGKSELTAMACNLLCSSGNEKILVIAPRKEQAKVIMDYIIQHIFDNPIFQKQIDYEGSWDRFKRERSKSRIDWRTGASIKILTADVRTVSNEAKSLMGFGADIVIVDESSLIPDEMFSKILRMVGGTDGKLVQLSNPWERNHFFKAFYDKRYRKVSIDYRQALKEGRVTQEFIDEARENINEIDWQVFYQCVFPDSSEDTLIPLSKIEAARDRTLKAKGERHLGGDVARFGSDANVAIVRHGNKVTKVEKWQKVDLVETRIRFQKIIDAGMDKVKIDEIGLGGGPVDEMNKNGYSKYGYIDKNGDNSVGLNVAGKAQNDEYSNIRAEMYFGIADRFIAEDIDIPNDGELIKELAAIRYSHNSRGQKVIESKEKMKRRGIKSPNKADALALAFYHKEEEKADFTFF